jgi:hypothetical protein
MTDALRIGSTRGEADSRRRTYRSLLLTVLVVQVLAGLLALIWPLCVSQWLSLPAPSPDGWLRAFGFMLLVAAALYAPGYINPVYVRTPNVVGIVSRFGLAILFFCMGGNFRWLALYEIVVAVALALTYQRLLGAELMSRP